MKNALSNVNGWLGGIVGLLKTVIVFFVFAAIVWPTGIPNVIGNYEPCRYVLRWWISRAFSSMCICFFYGLINHL